MAVGEYQLPEMLAISGVKLGCANARIKPTEQDDVTVISLPEGSTVAAVFTKNAFCAAPVTIAKGHLAQTTPKYLLINTGNANAGTGEQGFKAALDTVNALAKLTDVNANQILPFSTGVIGEPLPTEKIINALAPAINDANAQGWQRAATAILTTDTRPKGVSREVVIADKVLRVTGICKGSGMIHPNMATMLAYVAIEAKASKAVLQELLNQANEASFNSITVDGDTSTNDAALLIANGNAEVDLDALNSHDFELVQAVITETFIELAQLIIKDGEGASKFVEVNVVGGADYTECKQVAFTVAHSPLVKTALFASDANWGRILAAVGRAGLHDLDVNKVQLFLDDVLIADNGGRADSYTEEQGAAVMTQEAITITVSLNRGDAQAKVWTCDFSHDYVSINADYRS